MPVLQRINKPTTRKGRKILLSREPQTVEFTKQTFIVKGRQSGELLNDCMKDLFALKKPDAVMLSRKHDILPFEDSSVIEQFGKKRNANLFIFGSHTKKRPNNLILGRLFNHELMDMVELGVEKFIPLKDFKTDKVSPGLKPCLIFNGEVWSQQHEYQRLKNILVDMFHREPINSVRLQGLEHVLSFSAADGCIFLRSFKTLLKKSGHRTPRVELEEIGPSLDLKLRRSKLASADLFKTACKQPVQLKIHKTKNISKDGLGNTHGRIHIPKQQIDRLQTRKMKGLKKSPAERKEERATLKKRRAAAPIASRKSPAKKSRSE